MAEDQRVDPATHAASCLAQTIAAYRDLLNDAGFADVLPAFEQLRVALPDPSEVGVPGPCRREVETVTPLDGPVAPATQPADPLQPGVPR